MKFSVRVSYPESGKYKWFEAVKTYEDIGFVEVAFLDPELFLGAKINDIIIPFEKTNIEVSSIHFAQFNLSKLDLFLITRRGGQSSTHFSAWVSTGFKS